VDGRRLKTVDGRDDVVPAGSNGGELKLTRLASCRRLWPALGVSQFDLNARKNCARLIDDAAAQGNTGLPLGGVGDSAQKNQRRYGEELSHGTGVYSASALPVTFDSTPSSIGVMIRS